MEDLMRVKRLVAYCTKKCGTSDPFEIADHLGILYQIGNCEHEGCYMFLKNHRYIFLSNRLDRTELNLVMLFWTERPTAILSGIKRCS